MAKLTKVEVDRLAKEPGRHRVDENLYLRVRPGKDGPRAVWMFMYAFSGNDRSLSLGTYPEVSLAAARDQAHEKRALLARGIDPKLRRQEETAVAVRLSHTFAHAAKAYMDARAGTAMGARKRTAAPTTIASWRYMFDKHVLPKIGSKPVDSIDTADAVGVLEPIAGTIPVACEEIRRVCTEILNYAVSKGWRERKHNDFAWKGHLQYNPAIPNLARDHAPQHRAALPYSQIPDLVRILQDIGNNPIVTKAMPALRHVAARVLEFLIYTHVRPANARMARWCDIDMDARVWTIAGRDVSQDDPVGVRMKAKRPHRVPLSTPAILLLRKHQGQHAIYVFPGIPSKGKPLNACTPGRLLDTLGFKDPSTGELIEPHGFRTSCRTWAVAMDCPHVIAELMLAHDHATNTERAYIRGEERFEERRKWTEMWGQFCNTPFEPDEKIVPMRKESA